MVSLQTAWERALKWMNCLVHLNSHLQGFQTKHIKTNAINGLLPACVSRRL